MITQFVEELPEGKTTPDFTRKPIALTIQEGTVNIYAKDDGCCYVVLWQRAVEVRCSALNYKMYQIYLKKLHALHIQNSILIRKVCLQQNHIEMINATIHTFHAFFFFLR